MRTSSLTISIPTFNRAQYLARLLSSIEQFRHEYKGVLEVLVCDNASTDHTKEVIAEYSQRGVISRSWFGEKNSGIDGNIRRGFLEATSEYVWIFGDDDVLVADTLSVMNSLLLPGKYGLVHIGGFSFKGGFKKKAKFFMNLGPSRDTTPIGLAKTAGALLTFITANIVNKHAIIQKFPNRTFDEYVGTGLNVLTHTFGALKVGLPCRIVSKPLFGAQLANSGGYAFCETFSKHLLAVLEKEFPGNNQVRDAMCNGILERSMPYYLVFLRQKHNFLGEDRLGVLEVAYGQNYRFWLICYPIIKLPLFAAKVYSFSVRAVLKTKRVLYETWQHIAYRINPTWLD